MKKIFILLFLLMVMAVSVAFAADDTSYTYGDYEYRISDEFEDNFASSGGKCAAITGYSGNESNLIIPDQMDGMPVGLIDYYAFYECDSLESVTIPEGVRGIMRSAFDHCQFLQEVHLPNTLETIDDHAFFRCSHLWHIELPDSLRYIGNCAFTTDNSGNGSHMNIDLKPEHPYLDVIDDVILSKDHRYLFCARFGFDSDENENYIVPEDVVSIQGGAFSGCDWLKSITLPEDLVYIGEDAFRGCKRLEEIVLPDSLEVIGESAFANCNRLQNVIVPFGVKEIGDWAFGGCTNLKTAVFLTPDVEIDTYYGYDYPKFVELFDNDNIHTLYGMPGSTIYQYAESSGIQFESYLQGSEWTSTDSADVLYFREDGELRVPSESGVLIPGRYTIDGNKVYYNLYIDGKSYDDSAIIQGNTLISQKTGHSFQCTSPMSDEITIKRFPKFLKYEETSDYLSNTRWKARTAEEYIHITGDNGEYQIVRCDEEGNVLYQYRVNDEGFLEHNRIRFEFELDFNSSTILLHSESGVERLDYVGTTNKYKMTEIALPPETTDIKWISISPKGSFLFGYSEEKGHLLYCTDSGVTKVIQANLTEDDRQTRRYLNAQQNVAIVWSADERYCTFYSNIGIHKFFDLYLVDTRTCKMEIISTSEGLPFSVKASSMCGATFDHSQNKLIYALATLYSNSEVKDGRKVSLMSYELATNENVELAAYELNQEKDDIYLYDDLFGLNNGSFVLRGYISTPEKSESKACLLVFRPGESGWQSKFQVFPEKNIHVYHMQISSDGNGVGAGRSKEKEYTFFTFSIDQNGEIVDYCSPYMISEAIDTIPHHVAAQTGNQQQIMVFLYAEEAFDFYIMIYDLVSRSAEFVDEPFDLYDTSGYLQGCEFLPQGVIWNGDLVLMAKEDGIHLYRLEEQY